jgi:hypothetical protein
VKPLTRWAMSFMMKTPLRNSEETPSAAACFPTGAAARSSGHRNVIKHRQSGKPVHGSYLQGEIACQWKQRRPPAEVRDRRSLVR